MSITKLTAVMSLVALSACGTSSKKESATVVTEQQAKAEGASLPSTAIIRVPVGADGQENHEAAEMRLVAQGATISDDTVASTFEASTAPASTVDELDQTSSTESFRGWIGCRNFRNRHFGNNIGWNWQFYQPTYLNYGYSYGYSYAGSYGYSQGCRRTHCGGGVFQQNNQYNYYQYNQSFGQNGYSNQGWDPSQTYTGGMF
ncbi:MAG: hypothetical protein NT027_10915 [Proteobacteria bacterium]|nr:hypothetical protein [Pseudomonadota bacterium]